MNNKTDMKFLRTDNVEAADRLRLLGFIEITEPNSSTFCFMNNGKKLTFDTEELRVVYSNTLYF